MQSQAIRNEQSFSGYGDADSSAETRRSNTDTGREQKADLYRTAEQNLFRSHSNSRGTPENSESGDADSH